MDTFINLAQNFHASQQGQNQGGNVQDQRYHEPQGLPQFDHSDVISQASEHAGDSGASSLFATAMSHLTSHGLHEHTQPIDENHITSAHTAAYSGGNTGNLDANSMGAAAAMQALKMFTSGQAGGSGGSSQLVSLAMGEASKLFDSRGGASSGSKQDVINGAAMTMMKLVVQSKISGTIGGGNSGGLGSIMGIANKFM